MMAAMSVAYHQLLDGVIQHLQELKALQTLNLTGCDHLSDAGVAELKKSLPALRVERRSRGE